MNYNPGTNLWRAVVAQAVNDIQLLMDKMQRDLDKKGWTDFRYTVDVASVESEINTPWFHQCCSNAGVSHNRIVTAIVDIKAKYKYSDMVLANICAKPNYNKRKKQCSVLPLKVSTSSKHSSSYRSLTAW